MIKNLIRSWLGLSSVSSERNAVQWLLQSEATGASTDTKESVTVSTSMGVAAYYAAIKAISEDLAKLPLKVYRENNTGGRTIEKGRVYDLLNKSPNTKMTAFTFRQTIVGHKLGWGNGYAEIERNGFGEPVALHIIHPSRITVKEDNGKIFYHVVSDPGKTVVLPAENVLHIKGLSDDGVLGLSVLACATQCLGLSIASQRYAAAFYGNAARPSGVIEYPGRLTKDAAERLRTSWEAAFTGAKNTGKTVVFEEGGKWNQITIPPNEAQFIETRQFQIEEIARWFRIPLHKLQHLLRSTYSNIEHQGMEYVEDCLMPHAVSVEKEATWKLLGNADLYAEHLFAAMLRGDSKTRAEFYTKMFNMAALSPNDIRRLENMEPVKVDGADSYYIQVNMQRIDKPLPAKEPPRMAPPKPTPEEREEDDMIAMAAFIKNQEKVFCHVVSKLTRKEVLAHSRVCVKYGPKEFTTWQCEFYKEHLTQAVDTITPLATSMLEALRCKHNGNLTEIIHSVFKPLAFLSPDAYTKAENELSTQRSRQLLESLLRRMEHV